MQVSRKQRKTAAMLSMLPSSCLYKRGYLTSIVLIFSENICCDLSSEVLCRLDSTEGVTTYFFMENMNKL